LLSELEPKIGGCVFLQAHMQLKFGHFEVPSSISWVNDSSWGHVFSRLVAPHGPTLVRIASKQLEIGSRRTRLDQFVLFIGLSRVLSLSCFYDVDLRARWREGTHASTYAEEQELGHIAEIEPHTAAIRLAVFAALGPDDIRHIAKPPSFHNP